MTDSLFALFLLSHALFVFLLGYYLKSAMQWYSYKIERVIFHYNKPIWHLIYFILPVVLYYIFYFFESYILFALAVLAYLVMLYFWRRKLDKPLHFTARVKRFFLFLLFSVVFTDTFYLSVGYGYFLGVLTPLILALIFSVAYENILFVGFKKEALRRLEAMSDLQIIAITASYGKTSIKNFLYHILSFKFDCYKTPRSVNTLAGLVLDINTSLPKNAKIYIAEAGARERGDIREIAEFLKPDIAIVGQIGAQHIEYFKTLENTRDTKMELLLSSKLKKAFVHVSANVNANNDKRVEVWGGEITFIKASLEGTKFGMMINENEVVFETKLLGAFNAVNLAVCIRVGLYLGLDAKTIQKAVSSVPSVEHRLQRIDAGGKIIIDDSFNGNFEGMKSSYELVKAYEGRKVLITPGIVESTKEENENLARMMDGIFDIIIITGSVNADVLNNAILRAHKIVLSDKSQLTTILAQNTKAGDLILFSNDAPTYM
ncbi:MAG: UDP-N-acetylmuramoyl-tripeptide--D-alanyl-D-alanine ligase [Campylobacteraceae bacterium]|jgi:UDP-N-acetylmuramoyl-tripeptide--D-alanyl-D-alanine ligase|nr:UDP-N-acetylmuramoyl-tripeptide--D-alanyl-D-alanine ligase [Campylobacteraceae bacterium]